MPLKASQLTLSASENGLEFDRPERPTQWDAIDVEYTQKRAEKTFFYLEYLGELKEDEKKVGQKCQQHSTASSSSRALSRRNIIVNLNLNRLRLC